MKRLIVGVCALALMLGGTLATGRSDRSAVAGPTAGGIASENVEYLGFVPFDQSTSTGVTIRGNWMYLTSWKNISIYNIKDRLNPKLTAQLPVGFMFENEDVAVSPDQTFLIFSEELPRNALHIYDIEDKGTDFATDPGVIQEIARVPGAGDHTTSCILKCKWSYGSDGSITNLENPGKPKFFDKENWHALIGLQGGAHDVTEVKPGFIVVSPLDTEPLFVNVKDPLKPKVLAKGNGLLPRSERGYLWHSGEWPQNAKDRWLLMQGEDNFNPRCTDKIGPFAVYNTRGYKKTKTFKLADTHKVENGVFVDGNPTANGLGCSAHWFEEHETFKGGGLVVGAWYEHGTRWVDVDTETGKIKEQDYFVPYGGSTSASYWAGYDIVYAVDYTRGIDILRYTKLPPPGPSATLAVSNLRPQRGKTISMKAGLRRCPGHAGTNIQLQRRKDGEFVTIAEKKLDDACKATFKVVANFDEAVFKSRWPKQDDDHRTGFSTNRKVVTHR